MGIRETLNQNPAITTGVTAGIILLAIVFIVWQLLPEGTPPIPKEQWYTIDDGKTWFADDIKKIAPFQKDGKEAVRVMVWTCDNGKTKFVSYMERYTPEAKKAAEQMMNQMQSGKPGQPPPMMGPEMMMMSGKEVKRPGDKEWVSIQDFQKAQAIMKVKCPNGEPDEKIEPVMP